MTGRAFLSAVALGILIEGGFGDRFPFYGLAALVVIYDAAATLGDYLRRRRDRDR